MSPIEGEYPSTDPSSGESTVLRRLLLIADGKRAVSKAMKGILVSASVSLAFISLMVPDCFAETKTVPAWYPNKSCVNEFERVGNACASQPLPISKMQQCIEEKVSAECMRQMKDAQSRLQKILPKCQEANDSYLKRLIAVCGKATNNNGACYDRVRRESEGEIQAACEGMQ